MRKERECFEKICRALNIRTQIILDAGFIKNIGGSALTDSTQEIPRDALADAQNGQVPATYVPLRNGIFLAVAAAAAEVHGCEAVYIGVIEADGSGYPDCTQAFIDSMTQTVRLGTTAKNLKIVTPLIHWDKAQIVEKALAAGAPLDLTWSCYAREDKACGHCDSCLLRLRGFARAGVQDPVIYAETK